MNKENIKKLIFQVISDSGDDSTRDGLKGTPERVSRLGDDDNFWTMGDTGPCGPCSAIFYDHGDHLEGDPPRPGNEPGDRYIEVWNLVFTQFDKGQDLKELKRQRGNNDQTMSKR